MKRALAGLLAAFSIACGGDDSNNGGGGDAASGDDGSNPGVDAGGDTSHGNDAPSGDDGPAPGPDAGDASDASHGGDAAGNPGLDVCGVTNGALAWVASIPKGGAASLTAVDIAAGPTSDVVVEDLAGTSTLEQRRWSKKGDAVSTHQDQAGAYVGTIFPSTIILDTNNDVFYGAMFTGMPQGANLGAKLIMNSVKPDGTPLFAWSQMNAQPASAGAPAVNVFHAGFDGSGGLHTPLGVPATGPQYFGSGVYCYAPNGSFSGISASNAVGPLAPGDAMWVTSQNNLWTARTLSATTDFGCGAPLPVPAGGGTALVLFGGGGNCISQKLLSLPNAAVKERAFRQGADGSLVFAVVYSGTIDFGGGPLTSMGTSSLAIARFDASGNFVASKSFGGAGSDFHAASVAGNSMGLVAVKSGYAGTVDLGGGPLPSNSDTVLAVFDATFKLKWTKVVTVGDKSALIATAGPCGFFLATNSPTVDLGTGPISSGGSIGVGALGL